VKTVALIPAAGSSNRMGFDKLFTPLEGVPVVIRSVQCILQVPAIAAVIIAVAEERLAHAQALLRAAGLASNRVQLVAGGVTRVHSVWNALQAVTGTPDLVAVHDAARPFVQPDVVQRALADATIHGGALVATRVIPTLKTVNSDLRVIATIDRAGVWAAATPQVFRYQQFLQAYQLFWQRHDDPSSITDDCGIFERAGGTIRIVESNHENIKITTPFDWRVAELLAKDIGAATANG